MPVVFADAGYWTALLNPRDQLHQRALQAREQLGGTTIVTTQLVLTEVLNSASKAYSRAAASELVDALTADPNVDVVPLSADQFEQAFRRYASRRDQEWSLVDCASFIEMEARGITEALAADRDFLQAGFVPLLLEA